ncbi:hypothetical protein L7F22_035442 [Adiantum nelumboides]|nr:hypothetical protein [Adiantum nelumboides]
MASRTESKARAAIEDLNKERPLDVHYIELDLMKLTQQRHVQSSLPPRKTSCTFSSTTQASWMPLQAHRRRHRAVLSGQPPHPLCPLSAPRTNHGEDGEGVRPPCRLINLSSLP